MSTTPAFTLNAAGKTFATGLLPALIAITRQAPPGTLLHLTGHLSLTPELERWCRLTRNTIVATTAAPETIWTIRLGELAQSFDSERPTGSRLWLYANFDCNLACDYCCVRASPRTPRRALGLARIQQIAAQAIPLGVAEIFLTGGEPFLLHDIAEIILACATAAPTTVLTNGMLFSGRRRQALAAIQHANITLQISLDSPTRALHDAHRGKGSWQRAWTGIEIARAMGFRTRIAATLETDDQVAEFQTFLTTSGVAPRDQVIRRVALRGLADIGVPIARADLIPEITITDAGVFWHPVGADDADLMVTPDIFPLATAFAAVAQAFAAEHQTRTRLAQIFNCA